MKLALGTVQFGMNYGISNKNGQIQAAEIERILAFAENCGIDTLDTAQAYGNAEAVLGKFNLKNFKIVTKLFDSDVLEHSLERLHVDSVYATMFHREGQVNDKTWRYFESLKAQKITKKIGVSAYSPQVLETLIEAYPVDIVQIPMNILDFRFFELAKVMKKKNIEIHTRSAFLQGLLLMPEDEIDCYFDDIKPILRQIPAPKLASALQCLDQIDAISKIVVGVTCLKDLEGIYEACQMKLAPFDYRKLNISDERYINPVNWPKKK